MKGLFQCPPQGIALGIMAISKAPCKHPQPCIEYVVVHELAHIVSKNHDTQFKAVLDKHLPLWEKYKNELNEFII